MTEEEKTQNWKSNVLAVDSIVKELLETISNTSDSLKNMFADETDTLNLESGIVLNSTLIKTLCNMQCAESETCLDYFLAEAKKQGIGEIKIRRNGDEDFIDEDLFCFVQVLKVVV